MVLVLAALRVLWPGGKEIGVEVVGSATVGLGEAQVAYVDSMKMPQTPILGQHCCLGMYD